MARFSRRILARHVAHELVRGNDQVVRQLAAYLVESHREKELELIVRDVEKALESEGTVVARVTSARALSETARAEIEQLLAARLSASRVALEAQVDESLLGGVVIRTASDEFDGSLRRSINRLKALKV